MASMKSNFVPGLGEGIPLAEFFDDIGRTGVGALVTGHDDDRPLVGGVGDKTLGPADEIFSVPPFGNCGELLGVGAGTRLCKGQGATVSALDTGDQIFLLLRLGAEKVDGVQG